VRIGILGAAKIAPKAVVHPARVLDGVTVEAVAARDRIRAESFAAEHDIPRVHDGYADLVNDPDVDVVYVPLPISEHAPWTMAALEAGKHVLCEKPLALNAPQAAEMDSAARRAGRHLVEAFHWCYHPNATRITELVRELGRVVEIQGRLDSPVPPEDIRYQAALGGGALMDLGCYPVHWLRTVTGEEPEVESATPVIGPPGVDVGMTATLRFPSGLVGRVSCCMEPGVTGGKPVIADLTVRGERGWFVATNPQSAQYGNPTRGWIDGQVIDETVEPDKTTYLYQLQALQRVVAGEQEALTGGADSIANMRVLDEIYRVSGLGVRGATVLVGETAS
jgi:predicted dehydrogenase